MTRLYYLATPMRSTILLLVIAAILVAVVVCVPIVALSLVIAAPAVFALRHTVVVSDAQPLALVVLVPFRAPPA
jgi:hypothetical protein